MNEFKKAHTLVIGDRIHTDAGIFSPIRLITPTKRGLRITTETGRSFVWVRTSLVLVKR